jgi:hypothetical protein
MRTTAVFSYVSLEDGSSLNTFRAAAEVAIQLVGIKATPPRQVSITLKPVVAEVGAIESDDLQLTVEVCDDVEDHLVKIAGVVTIRI